MKLTLFIFTVILTLSNASFAWTTIDQCQKIVTSKLSAKTKLDYIQLIVSKGINPYHFKFQTQTLKDDSQIQIVVSYRDQDVGFLTAYKNNHSSGYEFYETHSELKDEFTGKKIGSALYLLLGNIIKQRYNLNLVSNPVNAFLLSPPAKAMWEKLVDLGLAKVDKKFNGQIRYRLRSKKITEKVDRNIWDLYLKRNKDEVLAPQELSAEDEALVRSFYDSVSE